MTQFQLERPLITFLLPPHPSDNGTHLLKPNLCISLHRGPGGKAPITLINPRQGKELIPRLFLIRTLVCSVITTSQESQTPCTLTPQPQAANTPQGLCTSDPHSAPWLGTQEGRTGIPTSGCNSSLPITSSSSGWSPPAPVPQQSSEPCSHPRTLLCSHREKGKPTPWSSSPCRHPQKAMPDPPDTKTFSWLSCPASPTSDPHGNSPQNSCAWGQGDAGT